MNIGAAASIVSAAGAPLAQSKGTDVARAAGDASGHSRQVDSVERAETAAGIGKADGEQHQTTDRDADGRRLWEEPAEAGQQSNSDEPLDEHSPEMQPHASKDATGDSGHQLDLFG